VDVTRPGAEGLRLLRLVLLRSDAAADRHRRGHRDRPPWLVAGLRRGQRLDDGGAGRSGPLRGRPHGRCDPRGSAGPRGGRCLGGRTRRRHLHAGTQARDGGTLRRVPHPAGRDRHHGGDVRDVDLGLSRIPLQAGGPLRPDRLLHTPVGLGADPRGSGTGARGGARLSGGPRRPGRRTRRLRRPPVTPAVPTPLPTLCGRAVPVGRPLVMAIVNRTPDSFYDRGATFTDTAAMRRVEEAVDAGADIRDIGGVKAGPGDRVDAAEETRRVVPFVEEVRRRHPDVLISVDTWRGDVARRAVTAGADLVNDTWAGHDPGVLVAAGEAGAGFVCSHTGGAVPRTRPFRVGYEDVVADVVRELTA